jgi:hypothetical protein
MDEKKEKPSVETVQQPVKVSDLLMYEVCKPLKEQLDRIELCSPFIVDCAPMIVACKPDLQCIPDKFCTPDIVCKPVYSCVPDTVVCKPDIWCKPTILTCVPDHRPPICKPTFFYEVCTPSAKPGEFEEIATSPQILKQRLLASDYVKLQEEVKNLKEEVEALKRRLK